MAILLQAAVITSVIVKDHGGGSDNFVVASAGHQGSFARVRFAPQATATDITNFLGAYKAKLVDGPLNVGMYRIQLSETKLPPGETSKIVRQMQGEAKIVSLVAVEE